MSKQKYIHIITILGLISIFSLQSLWLCNTYLFVKEEIKKECTDLFDQALYKEANIISKSVPEGTVIGGGAPNDSISITTYIYDGISKLGYKYSLSEIDSGFILVPKNPITLGVSLTRCQVESFIIILIKTYLGKNFFSVETFLPRLTSETS